MVPFVTYLLPLFTLLIQMQDLLHIPMVNTYWGMALPWMISPFGVFLMRQAMYSRAGRDARRRPDRRGLGLDHVLARRRPAGEAEHGGAGAAGIHLPVRRPVVAAGGGAEPPTCIRSRIGLVEFIGDFFVEYDLYTAAAVMAIVPVAVIYLVLQRFIIEGIATQGLKG